MASDAVIEDIIDDRAEDSKPPKLSDREYDFVWGEWQYEAARAVLRELAVDIDSPIVVPDSQKKYSYQSKPISSVYNAMFKNCPVSIKKSYEAEVEMTRVLEDLMKKGIIKVDGRVNPTSPDSRVYRGEDYDLIAAGERISYSFEKEDS